jgi:hypothetical protein
MVRAGIPSSERVAAWAAFLVGGVLAVPVLVARYPPMGDLAMHEGLVAILRHLHDPSWVPPGLYYVDAPQANQLFPLAALLLGFVVSTLTACKLLVATIVLAAPVLAARLLAGLGRSRWLGVLAAPVACGWMFRWGLVANLTGFALFLLALPEIERLARRVSTGAVLRSAGYGAALFCAHESSAIALGLVAAMFALTRSGATRRPGDRWARLAGRLAPSALIAALTLLQWHASDRLLGANMRAIGADFGPDPIERLALLPGAVFGGSSARQLVLVGGAWVGALGTSAFFAREREPRRAPWRVALWRGRYAVLALLFVTLYLVFPMSLGGTTLLAHRFLPPACACLIVACAGRSTRLASIALAVAAPLAMLVTELPAFVASDASYRALDRIIALIPKDVAVAQLDLSPRGVGHVAPVPGATGRVLAERGGRMLFAMTDMPPNPVYVRDGRAWNEPVLRMARAPYAFMPAYDFTRFSYLLERNDDATRRAHVARALEPEAALVAEADEWSLFRTRLPTVEVDAPDRPLPSPPPETLGARLARLRASSSGQ